MKMEAVALAKTLGFSLKGSSGIFFASVEGCIDGIAVSVLLLRKGGVWLEARSPRIPADFQVLRAQWKKLFDAPASSGPLRALPVEVVKELHWMY